MTEVVLHGMHLATDFLEAVVGVLELHSGFAKLFILAPLKGFTTVVEFSSDLPMVPSCHELCVILRRWWWLGWLSMPVHNAKPTRVVYGEKGCGELAFYLTLEIISNQLPHKGANSMQSEMVKKLTHKYATTLKRLLVEG